MSASLKLVYSEAQKEQYRLAQMRALELRIKEREDKLKALRSQRDSFNRVVKSESYEQMLDNQRLKNLREGRFEMPVFEDQQV